MKREPTRLIVSVVILAAWVHSFTAGAQPAPDASDAEPDAVQTVGVVTFAPVPVGFRLLENFHFSSDGRRVLVNTDHPAQRKDVVQVFDVTTGKELFRREGVKPQIVALIGNAISPDGSRILLMEIDAAVTRHVHAVDVDTGRTVWSKNLAVAGGELFLNDPDLVLSSEMVNPKVYRLSLNDLKGGGGSRWEVELDKGLSPSLPRVSQDGQFVIGVRADDVTDLRVIELKSGREVAALEGSKRLQWPRFRSVAGRLEVVGLLDRHLVAWDAATGRALRDNAIPEPPGRLDQYFFSPDAQHFYIRRGRRITVLNTADAGVLASAEFPNGADMIAVGPKDLIVLRTVPGQFRIIRITPLTQ